MSVRPSICWSFINSAYFLFEASKPRKYRTYKGYVMTVFIVRILGLSFCLSFGLSISWPICLRSSTHRCTLAVLSLKVFLIVKKNKNRKSYLHTKSCTICNYILLSGMSNVLISPSVGQTNIFPVNVKLNYILHVFRCASASL